MTPAAFTVLILGACSSQPEAANDSVALDPAIEVEMPIASTADANAASSAAQDVEDVPEKAPIPARFRGTWAENAAACANLADPSRLTISGRTVRTPNAVLFGESFTVPAPGQFALEGKYEGSGNVGAAHYSINAAGDVLTDEGGGGMVRVRCP